MSRENSLNNIFMQFDKSAKQFCEETNGIFCEISSEYKGEEKPQNLKYRFAKIYYNSFAVKFIYTAHGIMSTVNSILECYVCFDKSEDSTEIPLPLATDYCDINVTAPLCIPFITNDDGMIQAFNCIGSVLKELLTKFADISYNPEYKAKILTAFTDEIKYIFEIDDSTDTNENIDILFYNFLTLRFTSDAFINSIKGNHAKAVKQLKKTKKLTGYEKRMINLWISKEKSELPDVSVIITNAETYNENGIPKTNFREFTTLILSWIILTPVTSAVYIGIYFLLVYIESLQSVYLMGPIYNFPLCILAGIITAIVASYFTRFKFYKWLCKKDYERHCEMDYIQNGGSADRLMKGFLVVIAIISIVGCVLLARWNLNFLSDGFIDNSKILSLQGDYYDYSEIECVYYKPYRVNYFDETLDFPSYVLVLKNGTEIDFYDYDDISNYETELLDYLRDKGIRIEDNKH